jgi:uncharacterized membrane protein
MRLTPLNIVSAVLILLATLPFLNASGQGETPVGFYYYILLVALCVISDLLFRGLLRNLKRIWIVELSFIIFVAVLLVLFKILS